jgi:outer membrane protein
MKKIVTPILIAVIVIMSAGFNSVQAQSKIAHINSNELLESMPEKAKLAAQIQEYAAKLEKQLMAMENEYRLKVEDFKQQQGVMTDAIQQVKLKEITDLETRIGEFRMNAQQDLQNEEARVLQPLIDRLRKAIDDVAKEKGYDYVLDTSLGVVLYSKGGADIMSMVKKKLATQ